jgi:ferritin-like metal-binding protein YciE
MPTIESLNDLCIDQLRDLYNAENQLTKALPKMANAANTPDLRQAFEDHLAQTEGHVHRLEQVFEHLGEKPSGKVCRAMQGLVAEGEEAIQQDGDPVIKDAALIAAAQRVEHYEIAGYGTVRNFAKILGENEVADILTQTLDEEADADKTLTSIAEKSINGQAAQVRS